VRDAAEDLSDASLPPAVGEDVYAESGSDGGGSAVEVDALDTGPRVLELIDYYKKRITRVLALSLDDAAPVEDSAGTLFRVVSVSGGAAVVLSGGERAYVVWAQIEEGAVSYLCTCGGAGGGESAELRSCLGASSSCCHARGLRASCAELADAAGVADDVALLGRFPVLDNASTPPTAECDVMYATTTAKKKGVFSVRFQSTWAAVVIRNKLNKQRAKKRVQRRAAFTLTSCAKDHWKCPHATSVGYWCSDLREAAAALAGDPAFVDPFKDVLLPTVAPRTDAPTVAVALAAEWAAFADEVRGRCSRNLLPCTEEVADCHLWDQLADTGRADGRPAHFPDVLCEAACFSCGNAYNGQGVKNTAATLHTLRGRVTVSLRRWTCSCGKLVPYDGAHDGLFASSKETVFTRTYLDVMTQMVFTGHGTLSSAAAVICFLLESTLSMSGADSGLARQTLITAAHRYARTLIVPASLYRCSKCKRLGDRPYEAVIADGQVLSILRNQSQALIRLTEDVVGVPIDVGNGSCLASATLRGAIRKRMTAERQAVVRLSKEDNSVLKRLAEEMSSVPPSHAVGRVTTKSSNLSWAAAFIYFSFYTNEISTTDPGDDRGADETAAADDNGVRGDDAGAAGGVGVADDEHLAAGGDGDEAGTGAARARGAYCVSKQVPGAVGVGLSATVERERWRVVRRFLLTFLGHPVVGAFSGLPRARIKRLAKRLALGAPLAEWKPLAKAVESVGIVWPFLQLVGTADEVDPQMTRAVGELLLFTCGVDSYWETLWRGQAAASAKDFEDKWRVASAPKYAAWAATRAAPLPDSSPLFCSQFSSVRGKAQMVEVLSGHVWPDLPPVRPFATDSKAEAVNATRAVRVKAGREALEAMLNKELGSDDCRHAFLASQTFMPGVENFLCPCGMLIGFDFLDRAESPAHVLASLMQRFPLLPSVVYFDTACQMARNASRRVPWLVNMSAMAASIDRAHRLQKQHGCSPVYDADAYPGRSVRHRTACAESRHSINKAFKTHLLHLRQDHFMVQMRLLGALVNLRVIMRRELGRETNHRLACKFFHNQVQLYCDRGSCTCAHGRRQDAQAAVADAAAAAAAEAAVVPAPDAAAAPATANVVDADAVEAAAELPAVDDPAVSVAAVPVAAVAPRAQEAQGLGRAVNDAVVGAVPPAVQAAVLGAVPVAAHQAAAILAAHLGKAAGQAAVEASYVAAHAAGRRHGGEDVGLAAAAEAARSAACVPLQADLEAAVNAAMISAVEDAAGAAGGSAAGVMGDHVGVTAGRAAGRAAVQAARFRHLPAAGVAGTASGMRGQVGDRPVFGQAALQAALRGALRAAEVNMDNRTGAPRERVGGDADNGGGVGDGGDGGDGDVRVGGAASPDAAAGAGASGGVGADQVDGIDVPRVDTDASSSDGLSSYSAGSDEDSDRESHLSS